MKNDKAKLKIFISIIIFIFSLSFLFVLAQGVMAEGPYEPCKGDSGCYGLHDTDKTATNLPTSKVGWDVPTLIGKIVGAGLAFVGVLFFILMIYGGLLWMTAQGNEQRVTKAKDLIIAAIVGLIIVLSAYAITAYIGGAITAPTATPS